METLEKNASSINVYFFRKNREYVYNNVDTYFGTIDREKVNVYGQLKLVFHEPVYHENGLFEVFPNLNVTSNISQDEYTMQLYYNLVKGLSRNSTQRIKFGKGGYQVKFFYGLNSKDVFVENGEIALINSVEYNALNDALSYIVAALLYEGIEQKPFVYQVSLEQEKQIKKVKFYLSKCYFNSWHVVREYLTCNREKIASRFANKLGYNNLREVDNSLK